MIIFKSMFSLPIDRFYSQKFSPLHGRHTLLIIIFYPRAYHYILPNVQQFNLEFQFEYGFKLEFQVKSIFKLEFQAEFGIQLGIPILMGINLGEYRQF